MNFVVKISDEELDMIGRNILNNMRLILILDEIKFDIDPNDIVLAKKEQISDIEFENIPNDYQSTDSNSPVIISGANLCNFQSNTIAMDEIRELLALIPDE